jgi:hypothetical protein
MTENDYYIAWGLYAFAALGCLLVWFRLTRWLWRWLREPLRVLGAVALFSPTIVDPAQNKFAPAIAITALDLLFKVAGNAWRAVSDLAMYAVIALAAYLLFALVRWPIERAGRARRAEADAEAQRRAERARQEAAEPYGEPYGEAAALEAGRYSAGSRVSTPAPKRPPEGGSMRIEPRL